MAVGKLKKIAGLRTLTELQDIEQSVSNPVGDIDNHQASGQGAEQGLVSSIQDIGFDLTDSLGASAETSEETEFSSLTSNDDGGASGGSIFAIESDAGDNFDFAGISLGDGESGSWQSALMSTNYGDAEFDWSYTGPADLEEAAAADVPAGDGGGDANAGDFAGGGDGDSGDSAPGAAGSLLTLANYLRSGYWTDTGRSAHQFNLNTSGTGSNSGTLYFNVAGFTGISGAGTDTNGLTSARADMVRDALDLYGDVLGINFVETTSQAGHVDLFFKDNASGAFANYDLHFLSSNIDYAWVNINSGWDSGNSNIGSYAFQTALHEIGHALGLGHQGDYNGSAVYSTDAIWENDSWQASMMSYFDQNENTYINASYARLTTQMAVDWIALDDIYGGMGYGVSNAFAGNTTYGFNTTIGVSSAPPVSNTLNNSFNQLSALADTNAFTIVDGGGIDTVDFSGFAANQTINIGFTSEFAASAKVSSVGGLTGNMTIAAGTQIENAKGGSGDDIIYGNSLVNILTGNAGIDNLYGYGGNDTLYGNDGNDYLSGGTGNDILYGGAGDDHMDGNSGDDTFHGASGDDLVHAGSGNDTIYGNSGADNLFGQDGNDLITGGSGIDTVNGGNGNDTIYFLASQYWDNVDGGNGVDTIDASAINVSNGVFDFEAGTITGYGAGTRTLANVENFIGGETTNDTIISDGSGSFEGRGGNDTITAGLTGGFETETLNGGVGNDTLITTPYFGSYVINLITGVTNFAGESFINFENVTTGNGNDTITGTSGANIINSGGGADTIDAGSGADVINSGGGADAITGGFAIDTIDAGSGNDTIFFIGNQWWDNVDGGADDDTIDASAITHGGGVFDFQAGTITGFSGTQTVVNVENFIGGNTTDDTIISDGSGSYEGRGGNDTMTAGVSGLLDTEILDGGTGIDTLITTTVNTGNYSINMITGVTSWAGESFINFENIITGDTNGNIVGTGGNNIITTGAGNDTIAGGGGDDTINAGAGNDIINAGSGVDVVNGEAGDDTYFIYGGWTGGAGEIFNGGTGSDTFNSGNVNSIDATVNLATGTFTYTPGGAATIDLVSVENVTTGDGNDTITGSSGVNTIITAGGSDVIHAGSGTDTINSGTGNDKIYGESGVDTIDAGAGDDIIYFTSGHFWDNVDGGTGVDTIDASAITHTGGVFDFQAGTISGYGGTLSLANVENFIGGDATDDTIISDGNGSYSGGGGNDTITAGILGGGLAETLNGGTGIDKLITTTYSGDYTINMVTGVTNFGTESFINFENLTSGIGNDNITGTADDNVIYTGAGNDYISAGAGNDTLSGAGGNDRIIGGDGNDIVNGGAGVDRIYGQNNNDTLNGNDGNDIIYAGLGNDSASGGNGDDFVQGNAGIDIINGNDGNDTLYGGADNDTINGGIGNDSMFGQSGNDTMYGSFGHDDINGGAGDDNLNGNDGDDTIYGSIGDDTINGGNGADYLHGGAGIDIISGNAAGDTIYGYTENDVLHGGTGNDSVFGGDGNDSVYGDDNADTVRGGIGNDSVFGGSGTDMLFGDAGNDTLNGGLHNDILRGGIGNDTLTGGSGTDRFNFEDSWGLDILTDFANDGLEKINLFGVTGITALSDLTLTNIGADVQIAYMGNTILVQGLQDTDLDNTDFIF